jgi:hypothetical protein
MEHIILPHSKYVLKEKPLNLTLTVEGFLFENEVSSYN